jgi:hypothetical protein
MSGSLSQYSAKRSIPLPQTSHLRLIYPPVDVDVHTAVASVVATLGCIQAEVALYAWSIERLPVHFVAGAIGRLSGGSFTYTHAFSSFIFVKTDSMAKASVII